MAPVDNFDDIAAGALISSFRATRHLGTLHSMGTTDTDHGEVAH